MASTSRSSSSTWSGSVSPVRRYRSPPRSYVTASTENPSETASSTFSPSATTSGPVPSPGVTAIRYERPTLVEPPVGLGRLVRRAGGGDVPVRLHLAPPPGHQPPRGGHP